MRVHQLFNDTRSLSKIKKALEKSARASNQAVKWGGAWAKMRLPLGASFLPPHLLTEQELPSE
eukprot:679780-Heterocapsa_arctica.AAC.1